MKRCHTISWYLRAFSIVCLVAAFAAMPARGVESLAEGFLLWGDEDHDRFARLDLLPAAGIELVVDGETESTTSPTANQVKSKLKLFLRVMEADGASELGRLSKRVQVLSSDFPDPGDDMWQSFVPPNGPNDPTTWCNGNQSNCLLIVNGTDTAAGAREQVNRIFDYPEGMGVAENDDGGGGTLRTLVIGFGIKGHYAKTSTGFLAVNISKFSFASFDADPAAGKFTFLCQKTFLASVGNWELESGDAGVADYLAPATPADDEIRIVDFNDDIGKVRYRYYDPVDCSLLSTVKVKIIE